MLTATTACAAVAIGCTDGKTYVTPAQRLKDIARAQVWRPTEVRSMDIRNGPAGDTAFIPGQTVTCKYVAVRYNGNTPKFGCDLGHDDVVKVKFGRNNGEVYAEVAATRLLWALGFGADAMYPVKVLCRGCPAWVAAAGNPTDHGVMLDAAAIERKIPGRDIESSNMSGWTWDELDLVDPRVGGAPTAHRDALKLLAVLLQHSDNKAEQQRLICIGDSPHERKGADCEHPFLIIQDLGQTFGRANLFNRSAVGSVNLDLWADTPIWKDRARCIGNLAWSQTGTMANPAIAEAGRRFLADLLLQLTDDQVRDLFEVARFPDKPVEAVAGRAPIDGWVEAFRHKREDIVRTTCPP